MQEKRWRGIKPLRVRLDRAWVSIEPAVWPFLFEMLCMFVGFCAVYERAFAILCQLDATAWGTWALVVIAGVTALLGLRGLRTANETFRLEARAVITVDAIPTTRQADRTKRRSMEPFSLLRKAA